jgi:hypothetical protein
LGFVVKRPKKRLLKANPEKRAAFVSAYMALRAEAQASGAKIFFVDEAHFRADVELRTKWVLRGEPALVDSTSPKLGEKASYYSGVCLESGEVEAMSVTATCTAATAVTFLKQLRANHKAPLIVIWDNAPAHRKPDSDVPDVAGSQPAPRGVAVPQPRLQRGRGYLGLDSPRGDGEHLLWHDCPRAREGRRLLRRTG